jgi:hypothetical protein
MLYWYYRQVLVAPLYQLLNYFQSEKWQSTISDLVVSQGRVALFCSADMIYVAFILFFLVGE